MLNSPDSNTPDLNERLAVGLPEDSSGDIFSSEIDQRKLQMVLVSWLELEDKTFIKF